MRGSVVCIEYRAVYCADRENGSDGDSNRGADGAGLFILDRAGQAIRPTRDIDGDSCQIGEGFVPGDSVTMCTVVIKYL